MDILEGFGGCVSNSFILVPQCRRESCNGLLSLPVKLTKKLDNLNTCCFDVPIGLVPRFLQTFDNSRNSFPGVRSDFSEKYYCQ